MANVVYMTRERVQEIEQEVHQLKTKGRREIAQKIADARSHGDLSENADYDAAKEEQGLLEMKISKFENILSKVQVVKPEDFPNDKVYILSKVRIKNQNTGDIFDYVLVSPEEADFDKNKISVTSIVGKALMGKFAGDIVEVKVPAGITRYEIVEIGK